MADYLTDLVTQLYGADAEKNIAADNPFTPFQAVPDSISQVVTGLAAKGGGQYGLGELAGTSAISGLLSGLLGGLGTRYNTNTLTDYQAAIKNKIAGVDNPVDLGLSGNLLKKANDVADMTLLRRRLGQEDAIDNASSTVLGQQRAIDTLKKRVSEGKGGEEVLKKLTEGEAKPNPLQKDIIEETATVQKAQKANDYIDSTFEKSKELVGYKSFFDGSTTGIGTDKGNALKGLKDSMLLQIDNNLGQSGREINSDVRQRLLSLTPQWYDSPEAIDAKKDAFKALLATISKPTPVLNSMGVDTSLKSTPSISPEEARQKLRALGVPGY